MTDCITLWLSQLVEPPREDDRSVDNDRVSLTTDAAAWRDGDAPAGLERSADASNVPVPSRVPSLESLTAGESMDLLRQLDRLPPEQIQAPHMLNRGLRQLVTATLHAPSPPSGDPSSSPQDVSEFAERIAALYARWKQLVGAPRHLLLTWLAAKGDRTAWKTFADLIVTDPPAEISDVVEAFVPIWKRPSGPYEALFPRLFDGIQHSTSAVVILDLGNFLAETRRISRHPAAGRQAQLVALLGSLVERLEQYEEKSLQRQFADPQAARTVSESVTLTISVCHTLSLLGCRDAIGKLYRMLELSHRRLRIEAAYVLAQFDEQAGVDAIVESAADPAMRYRAVTYAEELGIENQLDEQQRTPVALAESRLIGLLSNPRYFGIPPAACRLRDQRHMFWPGYDDKVACFLFQFDYPTAQGVLTNVGLAGPETQVVASNVSHLDTEEIYALYAGLNVQHDDIRQIELSQLTASQQVEAQQIRQLIEQQGVNQLRSEFWVTFFDEHWLVATGRRSDQLGTAVASKASIDWVPQGDPQRPLDAMAAYALVLGRRILTHFNAGHDDGPNP